MILLRICGVVDTLLLITCMAERYNYTTIRTFSLSPFTTSSFFDRNSSISQVPTLPEVSSERRRRFQAEAARKLTTNISTSQPVSPLSSEECNGIPSHLGFIVQNCLYLWGQTISHFCEHTSRMNGVGQQALSSVIHLLYTA